MQTNTHHLEECHSQLQQMDAGSLPLQVCFWHLRSTSFTCRKRIIALLSHIFIQLLLTMYILIDHAANHLSQNIYRLNFWVFLCVNVFTDSHWVPYSVRNTYKRHETCLRLVIYHSKDHECLYCRPVVHAVRE